MYSNLTIDVEAVAANLSPIHFKVEFVGLCSSCVPATVPGTRMQELYSPLSGSSF